MWKALFLFSLFLTSSAMAFTFSQDFLFGVASAPAHVEDELDDSWLEFAQSGHVKAFHNTFKPSMRVAFWTQPEKEIELLKELKVDIYRMGISWERLVPKDPIQKDGSLKQIIDEKAVLHYHKILQELKKNHIKIMLTLFHHSMPKWAHERGGFKNELVQKAFFEFSKTVYKKFSKEIDYWISFNEPNVYAFLTYVQGIWPYGEKSYLAALKFPFYQGRFFDELDAMIKVHKKIYNFIKKENADALVSIAHNFAFYQGLDLLGKVMANWSQNYMNDYFVDAVKEHLDFLGMNYYGTEFFKGGKLIFHPNHLYSEAGRAVSPSGFLYLLKQNYQKYKLPLFITENGVADRTDVIRPPYLVEHLRGVSLAIKEGVKILGYIHWTLSDNWEWADGYCPKFGLTAVDRENNFKRIKRPSFNLYRKIIEDHAVKDILYQKIWQDFFQTKITEYYLCRDKDQVQGLEVPRKVKLDKKDWRLKIK